MRASFPPVGPVENSMALPVELKPAAQPAPGARRFIRVDLAEAHRIAGTRLGQRRKIGGDHRGDDRVTAGRRMIWQHDRLPIMTGTSIPPRTARYARKPGPIGPSSRVEPAVTLTARQPTVPAT